MMFQPKIMGHKIIHSTKTQTTTRILLGIFFIFKGTGPDYWTFLNTRWRNQIFVFSRQISSIPQPHISKFSALYDTYGLGAVKNIWILF